MSSKNNFQLFILTILLLFFRPEIVLCQNEVYSAKQTTFSKDIYEEFSPSFYNKGLVFCSNRKNVSAFSYQNSSKSFVSLFYTEINDTNKTNKISFFANELTTQLNDGPAAFSSDGNTVYFSRNISSHKILKDRRDSKNNIGIFYSNLHKGKWIRIEAFPFNSTNYSIKTPSINISGNRMFFSSDQPGGYGGFDLYYSDFTNNKWQEPINLGPKVNTAANEVFPFVANDNKLFFSTAGHGGLGGLDIFYTREINNIWINPVHVESAINSSFDDFGLITDNNLTSGFFSTNRNGSDDIFYFRKNLIQFESCSEQKENKFCFQFSDERLNLNDTVNAMYEWDFGNKVKINGERVKYCFPKEGKYTVVLRVLNPENGDTINTPEPYSFELKNKEQAFINSTVNGYVGEPIEFDATQSNLPNFKIDEYYWDFGEGFSHTGIMKTYSFSKEGEYIVKLGLYGTAGDMEEITKVCVFKKIIIEKKQK